MSLMINNVQIANENFNETNWNDDNKWKWQNSCIVDVEWFDRWRDFCFLIFNYATKRFNFLFRLSNNRKKQIKFRRFAFRSWWRCIRIFIHFFRFWNSSCRKKCQINWRTKRRKKSIEMHAFIEIDTIAIFRSISKLCDTFSRFVFSFFVFNIWLRRVKRCASTNVFVFVSKKSNANVSKRLIFSLLRF